MAPEELHKKLHQQPFESFRLVLSDGAGYDIRDPELLWIGLQTAYVGLTSQPEQTFFERSVRVELNDITRIEPYRQ